MRSYDTATGNYIAGRTDVMARHLVWITAKERDTGDPAAMGLWNGDDEQAFTINGEARTYTGAGAMVDIEPLRAGVGLDVRMHQIILSGITSETEQLIRGYDARLAPVEIHRALFSPRDRLLVAAPVRMLKGFVDTISFKTAAAGGTGAVTVAIASASRSLTRPLQTLRSDAAQQEAFANDYFRRFTDISGEVGVWWGEKRS